MTAGASKKKTGKQRGVKHPTPVSRQNTPFCFQPKRDKSMMSVARFNARSASSKVNHTPLSIYMENFGRELGIGARNVSFPTKVLAFPKMVASFREKTQVFGLIWLILFPWGGSS